MIVFGQFQFSWEMLYIFPAVLVVLVFGSALALLLSALNVYLRDIQYLVDVLVVMLFWASPIVYSYANVSGSVVGGTWIEQVYLLNPITTAVIAFQRATWLTSPNVQEQLADKGVPATSWYPADLDLRLALAFGAGLVILWLAHRLFARLQGNFAQEI
jgi:ABC-2 type transport system permease protein